MYRFLRTTAFRLALRYSSLYLLIAMIGTGVLYWATGRYVDAQIESGLHQQIETYREIYQESGAEGLTHAINAATRLYDRRRLRSSIYIDARGNHLAGDMLSWPRRVNTEGRVKNVEIDDDWFHGRDDNREGFWPTITTRFSDGSKLLLTQSIRHAKSQQAFILNTLLSTLGLMIALTFVLALHMAQRMLRRIDSVNATASEILAGRLNKRVEITGDGDEFDDLASNLNDMLNHIDRLIEGMRQVTDNVAHDLRAPLTRLRNRLEVTLLETPDMKRNQHALSATLSDVEAILNTFNSLLNIAQAESGQTRGEMETLDLTALSEEFYSLYSDVFAESGLELNARIESGILFKGNRQLLAQALSNLLENAIKHADSANQVDLILQTTAKHLTLGVADDGSGIPKDQFKKVTDRFVRLDSARSIPGNGLGLSLVKAIAELHGGELILEDNKPGLSISLQLPKAR